MTSPSPTADGTELSFEQALEQLEIVVRKLEDGQLGLSESLTAYEAGVRHLRQCYQALETAQRRIEILTGMDAAGNAVTRPFAEETQSLEQKVEDRPRRRSARAERPAAAPVASPLANDQDVDDSPSLF